MAESAAFTSEQTEFSAMLARFLAEHHPTTRVRQLIETPAVFDRAVWNSLARELGAQAIHLPEAVGGSGFGPIELGIVQEACGRHLYCGPYLSSAVMASGALLAVATERALDGLAPLADGSSIGVLVLDALDDPGRLGHALTVAGGRLDGCAPIVFGTEAADLWLTIARDAAGGGLGLYRMTEAPKTEARTALDPTRPLARVLCAGLPVEHLGPLSPAAIAALWDYFSVALAHELVGAAEALLYSTIEYMKVRVQFGRAIGSFQALKHRCADLLLEVELAKALAREGARVLAVGGSSRQAAAMAKAQASDAAMSAARAAIQLRGGIGFTWEEDTQLWFKRVKSAEMLFGSPAQHREWLLAAMEASDHAG